MMMVWMDGMVGEEGETTKLKLLARRFSFGQLLSAIPAKKFPSLSTGC